MMTLRLMFIHGLFLLIGGAVGADSPPSAAAGRLRVIVEHVSPDGDVSRLPNARVILFTSDGREIGRVTTDGQGQGLLAHLPPGEYIIQAELEAFRTLRQRVTVPAGETTRQRLQMTLIGPANEIHVPGQTDGAPDHAVLPEIIRQRLLQNVPLLDEQFQDTLPLLPSVIRSPDGQLNMKGARASQSGLLVNSVNVTDPVTGEFAMDLPLEAIESMEVYLHPYAAEFGKFTGAVTSIETRSGTNRWQFGMTGFIPRPRWRNGTINGIRSFTPRLSFSGPLVKDKLWFAFNSEYRFIRQRVYSLPDPDNETVLESYDFFSRLDWQINADHRLRSAFSRYPQTVSYVNMNTFHPRESTANFRQRGFFLAFSEQAVIHLNSVLETTFSIKDYDADIWANSATETTITPDGWQGGYFNRQERFSRRYEFSQEYAHAPFRWHGIHLAKAGCTVAHAAYESADDSRPVNIRRADGSLSQRIEFLGSPSVAGDITELTVFLQDDWQPRDWLNLHLGLRFDRDSLSRTNNVAPRLGFALLPVPGDDRTVIRGGFGLFYDKIPLIAGVFPQYQHMQVTRYGPADDNFSLDTTRYRNVILDNTLANPYSLTWNVEADRRITDHLLLRLGYLQRNQRRDLLLNVADDGEPRLMLSNGGKSNYREGLFILKYMFSTRGEFSFSYVRSSSQGNLNHYQNFLGNYHQPIIREDEYGPEPYDVPHRFLFSGIITLPWDLTVSPTVEYRNGFPWSVVDEDQNFVGERNRGGRFPRFFSADIQIARSLSIPFRGRTYHTRLVLGVYNLTHHWNPRDVQNNLDSDAFGGFYNSVGRKFRFRLEFDF
ncbi:MAG: TonB-dependent receptor [Acidobacteria bacterium]|nr:TonB-dependent receptor [Acidobacteriota bacterium]